MKRVRKSGLLRSQPEVRKSRGPWAFAVVRDLPRPLSLPTSGLPDFRTSGL